MSAKWQQRRNKELADAGRRKTEKRAFAIANGMAIDALVKDMGPDPGSNAGGGARLVFNMSSSNIPSFCDASTAPGATAYKNTYELGKTKRLGETPPATTQTRRQMVDQAVHHVTRLLPEKMYFGAVEVNGTGVRFYGDYCLVLKVSCDEEWVLDRNSYDVARPPLAEPGPLDMKQLTRSVESISGKWGNDLAHMLVVKTFSIARVASRRLTVGQISGAVLADEDYVEVLYGKSFSTYDLAEARTSAADAARESAIADRTLHGPAPSAVEHLWRRRRQLAEHALSNKGIPLRVVAANGRVR